MAWVQRGSDVCEKEATEAHRSWVGFIKGQDKSRLGS